jgi:hypothetical protein
MVCLFLPKGPPNSARMHTIVTAVLQQQYLQTELILWICLVIRNWQFRYDVSTEMYLLPLLNTESKVSRQANKARAFAGHGVNLQTKKKKNNAFGLLFFTLVH